MTPDEKKTIDALIEDLSFIDGAILGRQGCGQAMARVRSAIKKALALRGPLPVPSPHGGGR